MRTKKYSKSRVGRTVTPWRLMVEGNSGGSSAVSSTYGANMKNYSRVLERREVPTPVTLTVVRR